MSLSLISSAQRKPCGPQPVQSLSLSVIVLLFKTSIRENVVKVIDISNNISIEVCARARARVCVCVWGGVHVYVCRPYVCTTQYVVNTTPTGPEYGKWGRAADVSPYAGEGQRPLPYGPSAGRTRTCRGPGGPDQDRGTFRPRQNSTTIQTLPSPSETRMAWIYW